MITVDEAKTRFGITGTQDDAYLTSQIALAQDMIEKYCGRVFSAGSVTETFPLEGGFYEWWLSNYRKPWTDFRLMLSTPPINSVTSVTTNGTALTANTQYRTEPAEGIIILNSSVAYLLDTTNASANLEVVYNGGIAVPDAVKEVCYDIVGSRYNTKDADAFAGPLRSESIPEAVRITYDTRNGSGLAGSSGSMAQRYGDILDWYRLEGGLGY